MDLSLKTYSLILGESRTRMFHHALKNKFIRGALASMKSSVITLLFRPDFIVWTLTTESGNVNAMGVIGPWGGRGKMRHSVIQGKGAQSP